MRNSGELAAIPTSLGRGERIKEALLQYGLTQSDFAELAGIDPSTLTHLFSGNQLSQRTQGKIRKALETLQRERSPIPTSQELRRRIKGALPQYGLTQLAFAELAGVKPPNFSLFLSGTAEAC